MKPAYASAPWGIADVDEMADVLRRLALRALGRILGSEDQFGNRSAEDVERLSVAFPSTVEHHRSVARAVKDLDGNFLVTDPPAWQASQRVWAAQSVEVSKLTRLRTFLDRAFRRRKHDPVAELPDMIKAIAKDAWLSADFRADVAAEIWAVLRKEVILHPFDGEDPRLSNTFWWVAISTEARAGLSATAPPHLRRAVQSIEGFALAEAAEPGWAGFWDQYLIRRGSENGFALTPLLNSLPIFDVTGPGGPNAEQSASDDATDDRGFGTRAAPAGWWDDAPGFAGRLLSRQI